MRSLIEDVRLNAALDEIMAFVREINKAIELAAPWKTGKTDPKYTGRFLRQALEALANAACLFHPIMPGKMSEILRDVGLKEADNPCMKDNLVLKEGQPLPEKASLFPRVKLETPEKKQPEKAMKDQELVSIEDFKRIQLKVARITSAERAPKSDKLLIIEVELGTEKRKLVAGMAHCYKPEELIGKLVVMVANLKPARIRGIESYGMLLAAEQGDKLVFIVPDGEIEPGAEIL